MVRRYSTVPLFQIPSISSVTAHFGQRIENERQNTSYRHSDTNLNCHTADGSDFWCLKPQWKHRIIKKVATEKRAE